MTEGWQGVLFCLRIRRSAFACNGNDRLKIGNTIIEDTFAEGFGMRYVRLIITAVSPHWVDIAVSEFSGYGTSVIQCDAEVGLEGRIGADQTFDGRTGAAVLAFGFSTSALGTAVAKRAGQCLMTCATSAVFDGFGLVPSDESADEVADNGAINGEQRSAAETIPLGEHLKYFGDGFQKSKLLRGRRFWRIPVMDGEFICEQSAGVGRGVAGGNFLIQSVDQATGLLAAQRAVDAIARLPGVITPFPGGVVRSGSKVGSKYQSLVASTFDQYCPTLRGRVQTKLHRDANCVYEIVIDGTDFNRVGRAIAVGVRAAIGQGIVSIGAGNYEGRLGKHQFHLHHWLGDRSAETIN